MTMVGSPSITYNTKLKTLSFDNINYKTFRDPSFSSYLNTTEETFVNMLAESSRNMSMNTKKVQEGGEIGVFGAEKYFLGEIDHKESPRLVTAKVDPKNYQYVAKDEATNTGLRNAVLTGTPSVRSESSWNSQNALLQTSFKNSFRRKTKEKSNIKGFFANLGCKCSCSDANSVKTDGEHVSEICSTKKTTNSGLLGQEKAPPVQETNVLNKERCFSFPTMNLDAGIQNLVARPKFQEEGSLEVEITRKSLEVFGSPISEKRSKSLSLEKQLKMLSRDPFPRTEEPTKFSVTSSTNYNDSESDASSDLFEIESLTGKPKAFFARQESDTESGCVTPTNCYAPSEASIEWSVVTASAADFSVMSDCEERRSTAPRVPLNNDNLKGKQNKEIQRRRSGSLLLGCKSQKALEIAKDAYIVTDNQKGNYDSHVSMFESKAKLVGLTSRNNIPTGSRPNSRSPNSSQLIYIK